MEMTNAAFPLLKGMSLILRANSRQVELFSSLRFLHSCHEYGSIGVITITNVVEACKDVNIAVMLGRYPCKEITLRKDMLYTNVFIYKAQALAFEEHAVANCKVTI